MSFVHFNKKVISVNEMNERLRYVKEYRRCYNGAKPSNVSLCNINAFYNDYLTKFELTYKSGAAAKTACTYVCSKLDRDITIEEYVLPAWKALNQCYKVPDLIALDKRWESMSASPFLWYDDGWQRKRFTAWSYDVNSAYSFAMLKQMPNTEKMWRSGCIGPGEVGFRVVPKWNKDGDMCVAELREGVYCDFIFELVDSPFTEFVDKYYTMKKQATTPEERNRAKAYLNIAVGYLQRRNPALRAMILYWANEYIRGFMDENTVLVNTDCIVSRVQRDDIPVNNELGSFKMEHDGELFAYVGNNYQWNDELPAYRGIPKEWFIEHNQQHQEHWDILRDRLPMNSNHWYYDDYEMQLYPTNIYG